MNQESLFVSSALLSTSSSSALHVSTSSRSSSAPRVKKSLTVSIGDPSKGKKIDFIRGTSFAGTPVTLRASGHSKEGAKRFVVFNSAEAGGTAAPPRSVLDGLLPNRPRARRGKRHDIKTILLLGSGPIVIGSACEFDYSGSQAVKALRAEGYKVVLVNSNPATIMTDPEIADVTYIGPMTLDSIEQIIQKEKPDALLPTMGGQTALNLAVDLSKSGILAKYGVELIGAKLDAIEKGEDRETFKELMESNGLPVCKGGIAENMDQARKMEQYIGTYPLIIRPAFTMGGSGGGVAYNHEEFEQLASSGLDISPVSQILIEQSLLGWKEFELEVMRDMEDNVVIICSIENLDPMGIHTGDSITVAPIQTLPDHEYQMLRDASIKIIRAVGVETGGSNIQFALDPESSDYVVIEMNPRVSRSSALASKATGFPIAKMAAKLSCGYSLVDIPNDITKKTPACFEPTIDYVVTKIPRFAFEKFPGSEPVLTTQMKSVGEAMAIGRCFQESMQKALRSLETGRSGWGCDRDEESVSLEKIRSNLAIPNPERIFFVRKAYESGMSVEDVFNLTKIDRWFLYKLEDLLEFERRVMPKGKKLDEFSSEEMLAIKQQGFSDKQIAYATGAKEIEVRNRRKALGVTPVYKTVDTCAAEFEAYTPYYYSSYEPNSEDGVKSECERMPSTRRKVIILGGGPNRIGQGIEFDYCCCHASFALRDHGFETIMINSNPETVSTDYDTSDRLYFEPLTLEDVANIIDAEQPEGIIVQFGGQTPLKLALQLQAYLDSMPDPADGRPRCRIWGTSPDSIDIAEDRKRFEALLRKRGITQPPNGLATNYGEAKEVAARVGYPVVVRPSYVLGGRAMEIVYDDAELSRYMTMVQKLAEGRDHPILIDHFLEDATEVDVDAIGDGTGQVIIGGIMEHIEQAGIHSGDSACSIPTQTLSEPVLQQIREWTIDLARDLNVIGLMNIQWAVQNDKVYILEANPRASRTVPFVSKAIGIPLAKYAALLMSGMTLEQLNFTKEVVPVHISVKEAVLPFEKFPGTDTLLGPEMRSTGEVMGVDYEFGKAFAKAQIAAFQKLPLKGTVYISVGDRQKPQIVELAKSYLELGFQVVATTGTRKFLLGHGLDVESVRKIYEGRPNVLDWIKNGWIQLLVMVGMGYDMQDEARTIRRTALQYKVPIVTTVAGAGATAAAIGAMQKGKMDMKPIQAYNLETHPNGVYGQKSNYVPTPAP